MSNLINDPYETMNPLSVLLQSAPIRGQSTLIDLLASLEGEDRVDMAQALSYLLDSYSFDSSTQVRIEACNERLVKALVDQEKRDAGKALSAKLELARVEAERRPIYLAT